MCRSNGGKRERSRRSRRFPSSCGCPNCGRNEKTRKRADSNDDWNGKSRTNFSTSSSVSVSWSLRCGGWDHRLPFNTIPKSMLNPGSRSTPTTLSSLTTESDEFTRHSTTPSNGNETTTSSAAPRKASEYVGYHKNASSSENRCEIGLIPGMTEIVTILVMGKVVAFARRVALR